MTMLWALLALGFMVFVGLTLPDAWEEHKRSELERAILKFAKAMGAVSVTLRASHKQVKEFAALLEKASLERQ